MNYRIIYHILGNMMNLLALFLIFPLICSFIYQENNQIKIAYLYTILISVMVSLIFRYLSDKKHMQKNFYTKEGFVIVVITWILFSVIGALPFYISHHIPYFIDAFFETVSGFTTTGASILTNIEIIPKSLVFWRSMTHFIGGLGVVVFALAILPRSPHNIHIMKAEVPGPMFGKVVSSMKKTAIFLYAIYIGLAILLFILLLFSGIGVFESINLTFSTAGTGGFATKNTGIAYYANDYVTFLLTVFMIIFSANLNMVYLLIFRKYLKALNSEELKWFITFILIATITITLNIYYTAGVANERFFDVLFIVSSIISTTGFTYINFSNWTMYSQIVILFLMIVGGCSGGTAGGLKIPRIIFILKNTINYIKKSITPNKVQSLKIENKTIEDASKISNYILLYLVTFSIFSILLSIQINDFEEIFSLVLSTLNNVGPGFNTFGPMENYAQVPYFSKFILSLSMLLGRLEIIPFIVLFAPQTWRRKKVR